MQITRNEDCSSLTLEGTLDISVAEDLRRALCDLLDGSSTAAVDFSAVDACDTAAFQLLVAARRTAEHDNKSLRFESMVGLADCAAAVGLNISQLTLEAGVEGGADGVQPG